MALTMSNALVGTGLVAKPAVRSVQARTGLKVFARMTKDRVGLKKDQKLGKSRIEIYPVRTRDSVNTLSSPVRRPLGTLPSMRSPRSRSFPTTAVPRRGPTPEGQRSHLAPTEKPADICPRPVSRRRVALRVRNGL